MSRTDRAFRYLYILLALIAAFLLGVIYSEYNTTAHTERQGPAILIPTSAEAEMRPDNARPVRSTPKIRAI
jgi:hypothetical protein